MSPIQSSLNLSLQSVLNKYGHEMYDNFWLTFASFSWTQWQARLSRMFMEAVAEIAVDYCKGDKNGNCYGNAVIAKR